MVDEEKRTNEALDASKKYNTVVEEANDYIEHFDILETITNVGNDEVFTPRKTCDMMLDSLPEEVWHNPLYKWLNPATKNGIFEREIALRLDKGLENVITDKEERRKHILQNMIFSIGQTKFTANVARRTLYYCSQANRPCDGLKASDSHYVNGYAIGNGSWFETEEGNIKTPCADHEYVDTNGRRMPSTCKGDDRKKYKCKYCGIAGDSKYNDANQLEKYAYEFIHVNHLVLNRYMQDRFFGGNRQMKFDIIIGNPPYQLSFGIDGGNSANAKSIYNLFISQAIALQPKYLCMITPSRWMTKTAQGIPEEWVDGMLKKHNFRQVIDFEDASECFPNNEIKGGVSYFLYDRDYNGPCDYYYHDSKEKKIYHRNGFLDSMNAGIVIRDPKSYEIIEKIAAVEGRYYENNNFSKLVSPKHFYDDSDMLTSNWKDYKTEKDSIHNIKYYVSKSFNDSSFGWISLQQIPKHRETVALHKVFIPAAGGSGNDDLVLGKPFYGEPNSVCSQTYLVIGWDVSAPKLTEKQCLNIIKYIQTRFFRYLVSVKKKTQNGPRGVYQFVPLQDFDEEWTDEKLFGKYSLSDEQISLIKKSIREV